MNTIRDECTNITSVDTHARTNTNVMLAPATGLVIDAVTFPTSPPRASSPRLIVPSAVGAATPGGLARFPIELFHGFH